MFGSLQARWRNLQADPQWQPVLANLGWLSFDKAARMLISLLVGGWVARHLGPGDYGVMNYALAIIMLVGVLPGLGLDSLIRRELVRHPGESDRLLGTAFVLQFAAGVAAYGLLLVAVLVFEDDLRARFIILLNGLSLVQSSTMVLNYWFQARLQSKYTVIAQTAAFVLSSLGRVVLILQGADLEAFAIMMLLDLPVTTGLTWYFYRRVGGRPGDWQWHATLARRLLRESWPLALSGIAVFVYLRIDQVMLKHLASDQETGLYGAAVRVAEIWNFVPAAITLSLVPMLVQARAGGSPAYERTVRRGLALVTLAAWLVALPTMLAAPWLVRLLFGSAYGPSVPMLVLLTAALPFLAVGTLRQEYLIYEGHTRFQLLTTLLGAGLNIALNLWLIPLWGGIGAALATLLACLASGWLTSFCWSRTRRIGIWQLQALLMPWRMSPPP